MNILPDHIWLNIFKYLDNSELWNVMNTSKYLAIIMANSKHLMLRFKCDKKIPQSLREIPFKNVSSNTRKLPFVPNKAHVQILELENVHVRFQDILSFLTGFVSLQTLILKKCKIVDVGTASRLRTGNDLKNLTEITFEKCSGPLFRVFKSKPSIVKLTVSNDDWTWNGFDHEEFNQLVQTLENIDTIILNGIGTGSYFDSDEFNYHIRKLETTVMTFHWYVGIRTSRTTFLRSQFNYLKDLRIHSLPFDFDGGRVLKFIIEEMKLDKFHYGDIPLIIDGEKAQVNSFSFNEIQICSMFEMFRQFPTSTLRAPQSGIRSLLFTLNKTDIDSSTVETAISREGVFPTVITLEIADESAYRSILGVYLDLFKKFPNLCTLKVKTTDRNINVLLEEFLPYMPCLKNIEIISNAPRLVEREAIIKKHLRLM